MNKKVTKIPSARSLYTNPSAWIVSSKDRGRKSIKNGKVYLKDNELFEIEIFNPLKVSVLAKIKLNGSFISHTGLVISPGERGYLDCFIDDKRRFIFKTYKVDNIEESIEAIKNNGLLEVFFYKESTIDWSIFNTTTTTTYPSYPTTNPYIYTTDTSGNSPLIGSFQTNTINGNLNSTTLTSSYTNYSNDLILNSISEDNIETGRIQKGEKSNQKFENINMDFEYSVCSQTIIQILPESNKPIYSSELKKKNKKVDLDTNFVELLTKLNDLYKSGILTNDEFESKKKEILDRI